MTNKGKWLKLGVTGLAFLAVVAAIVIVSVWKPQVKKPNPPELPQVNRLIPRAVAIAPGIYLLGKTDPAASYAIDTGDGLVLIDSGLDANAAAIASQLAELGLDMSRVRAILLTHVHADHSLGAARLRELAGAKVYAGRGDCPPLRAGQPREAFFSTFYMPDVPTHATAVDVELAGGEAIDIGNAHIKAIATPGHTPGSICYLLERPDQRVLFTGDVVQSLDPATEGMLGTYAAHLPPLYRGDANDYLTTLRRLRDLSPPDLVLPGHPRMDAEPQNPHLAPQRWQALLDKGIHEMEQLLERRKADGANFLDGQAKEVLPGLRYFGDVGGRAVYCLESPKGLFLFDAPGGPGLSDFVAARFKELGWKDRKLAGILLTSADDEAMAGLPALVKAHGCKVAVAKAGLDDARRLCPGGTVILTEEELAKASWFDVRPIALRGLGKAPIAYALRWAGKNVIISGRIPTKLSPPVRLQLIAEVNGPGGDYMAYLKSLEQLKEFRPDLWLPAAPVHGQTANLYDREWDNVIERNMQGLLR